MPSDRPEIYLRKILVDGIKPFHYRSGIRTLLGLPENADPRIAYPLALPLPGFNYLRHPSFIEGGIETSSETILLESENAELPKKAQFQKTKESSAKIEPRDAGAIRGSSETLSLPDTLKALVRPSGETRKPVLTHEKEGQQRAEHTHAEKLQIDIPGFSEKKLHFSALVPQKIEGTPSSETRAQAGPVQEKKEHQPQSAAIKLTNDTSNQSGASEESTSGPAPRPALFRQSERMSAHPISEFKVAERQHSVDGEIAGTPSPSRSTRALSPAKQAGKGQGVSIQPRQQAAEVQIEHLRQTLSTLKRKTVSHFQDGRDKPQAEPTLKNRPESALPPPVVIVNRTHAQRQTPAAFWERSYLGHMFRLRRLR